MTLESRLEDLDYELGRTFYTIGKSANPFFLANILSVYAKFLAGTSKDLIVDSYSKTRKKQKENKQHRKNMSAKEKLVDSFLGIGKSSIKTTGKAAKQTMDAIVSPQSFGVIAGLIAVNKVFYQNASRSLPFNTTLSSFSDYFMFIPRVTGNIFYSGARNTFGFLGDTLNSVANLSFSEFMQGLDKLSYLSGLDKEILKDISFASTKQLSSSIDEISPVLLGTSLFIIMGYCGIKRKQKEHKIVDVLSEENKLKPKSKRLNTSQLDKKIQKEINYRVPNISTSLMTGAYKVGFSYALTLALLGKGAEIYNQYADYIRNTSRVVNVSLGVTDLYYGFMSRTFLGIKHAFDYFTNKGLPSTVNLIGGDLAGQASYILGEIGKEGGRNLVATGTAVALVSSGIWCASKYNHFRTKASDKELNEIITKYK